MFPLVVPAAKSGEKSSMLITHIHIQTHMERVLYDVWLLLALPGMLFLIVAVFGVKVYHYIH